MKKIYKRISIVIPAYNESKIILDSATKVVKEIVEIQKESLVDSYEIIFVNDGSEDNTWSSIQKLHQQNPNILGISLSRNFGLQIALTAGLNKAKGDYTVMLECDLQEPPKLIKKMLIQLVKTNSDVVYGRRTSRSESLPKQLIFKLFHYVYHHLSKNGPPQNVGTFSIMNRRALNAILSFKEKNKYLPGLRHLIGYKQSFIDYKRLDRHDGPPKMTTSKLLELAFNAVFSFTDLPLKICFYLGIAGTVFSILIGLYALVTRLLNYHVTVGWSSTLLSIYFFGSIQLIFLGVIGQYIYKIYTEVQNRPSYFISDEIN
ncbi:glycosyltransferase family 2 protein [Candidatus Shapirobacteria bacterium]|nr:glycosyltransferase family 2 protein [Candidatus Shapirobacteria bacterium]